MRMGHTLNRNTRAANMTRLTWVGTMTGVPIPITLTRLTKIPRARSLIFLNFLDRLTMLASAISTEKPTGDGRKAGLCRLKVTATHVGLARMICPTGRRMFIRGWG